MGLITYFQDKIENKRLKDRINEILSITTFKELKMGQWKDVKAVVNRVDTDTDTIEIQIGSETFMFPYSHLLSLINGDEAFETIKRNIAIKLALSKIDLKNPIEVKQAVDAASFKYKE